ncbi:MAG: glycerophosphodiester phosphodiesterase [Candidatus Binatia bacterium]
MLQNYPFFADEKPRVFGHRGAMGEAPENTLPSFQRALEDGAQYIELDVRSSKEGEVVIMHDSTLKRTTNSRGYVRRQSLKELKALDAGYYFTTAGGIGYPYRGQKARIPTLEEFFLTFPGAKAIIEIKQHRPPIVQKVIEIICRLGKEEQVLLATEKDAIMKRIRRELDKKKMAIATGFSYGEVAAFLQWVAGSKKDPYRAPGQAFQIPCEYSGMTLVNEQTVAAAHDLGVEMFVWTINETAEMERLLCLAVDGIITDYPARLRELLVPDHRQEKTLPKQ